MIGTFLEISVTTQDMLASLAFYQALGFQELETNDTRTYPYAAVTDGNITIGLHAREFAEPTTTLVQPDLAKVALQFSETSHLVSMNIDPETFNEVSLTDADGHPLLLVEARTYSPPRQEPSESLLGEFLELSLPVRSSMASTQFWAPFSRNTLGIMQGDEMHMRLDIDGLAIGLSEKVRGRTPQLCYHVTDLAALGRALDRLGFAMRPCGIGLGECVGQLVTTEGLCLSFLQNDFMQSEF
ncbi:MAG: VOC family protein [Woeseiaceae bacterium]